MKEVLAKAESKMGKTIARLESDYAAIRAGRANPAVLDKVMVDYYGAPTPVNQLAAVSVAEARVLTIQPSAAPLSAPSRPRTSASTRSPTARPSASFSRRSPKRSVRIS